MNYYDVLVEFLSIRLASASSQGSVVLDEALGALMFALQAKLITFDQYDYLLEKYVIF